MKSKAKLFQLLEKRLKIFHQIFIHHQASSIKNLINADSIYLSFLSEKTPSKNHPIM